MQATTDREVRRWGSHDGHKMPLGISTYCPHCGEHGVFTMGRAFRIHTSSARSRTRGGQGRPSWSFTIDDATSIIIWTDAPPASPPRSLSST